MKTALLAIMLAAAPIPRDKDAAIRQLKATVKVLKKPMQQLQAELGQTKARAALHPAKRPIIAVETRPKHLYNTLGLTLSKARTAPRESLGR